MEFVKSATRLRMLYEEQRVCKYIFYENGTSSTLISFYEQAAIVGTWLIENNYSNSTAAIIGRNSTFSYMSFVSLVCY